MTSLGRYQILEELGRGAMGMVYLGKDPKINRTVALKCLRPHLSESNEGAVRRFQQEILALGRLIHPNIVTIFDVWEDPDSGSTYIIMEYIQGISLAQILKNNVPLSIDQIVRIGVQICNGLDFAHSKGVVHRDIKPGNILLTDDLYVTKIADFGIARLDNTAFTQTNHLTGTPLYMSPEQCRGETLDGRSDLFAVGTLLYELLTRQKAFQGDSATSIMHQVLNSTPYAPYLISDEVSEGFSAVVMEALEKDPERRFSSGLEMADALVTAIDETTATYSITGSLTEPALKKIDFLDTAPSLPSEDKIETTADDPPKVTQWPNAILWLSFILLGIIGIFFYFGMGANESSAPERHLTKPEQASPPILLGQVVFETTPEAADVSVDGQGKGRSPLSIDLPAGSHEILVTKEGYHDLEATIDVSSGEKIPIHLKLLKEGKQ